MVLIFIQVSIWKSLIGNSESNGITLLNMITYSVITTSVMNLLMTRVFLSIDHKLKSGDISTDLQKPISYPLYLFAEQLGVVGFQVVFTTIPSICISILLFGIQYPDAPNIVPFIISLLLAMIISYLLGYLIALISFWFLTTFALNWTITALISIFSGSLIPLWFFNPFWANLTSTLPFQYLGFVPSAIYLGKVEHPYYIILEGVGWVIGLLLIVNLLWWRAIKRLVIQGG
nr:ABC-2 family transporter protein [Paenibacillus taiwanensis]